LAKKEYLCEEKKQITNYAMKKLLILIAALFTISTLSAQVYKVGDYYDADGKKGVIFEVTEDGKHGKIIAEKQPVEKMTWHKAMEFGQQLKDGWYIPSYDEFEVLLDRLDVVGNKLQEVGVKAPHFCWSTTEFGADCAWCVSMRTDSKGGFYKGNKFNICIVSKF
jgi:hypothetical protein